MQTVNCFRHRVEVLIVLSFASNPGRDLRACSTAVKSLQRVKLIYYKNSRKPFIESRNKYKVQQNFCDRVTSRLSALPALLARLTVNCVVWSDHKFVPQTHYLPFTVLLGQKPKIVQSTPPPASPPPSLPFTVY